MIDFSKLDKTIHEKGRLSIMTLLASRAEPWSFQDLKCQLDMSDGNLITHLNYWLSKPGKKAFDSYLSILEEILNIGR